MHSLIKREKIKYEIKLKIIDRINKDLKEIENNLPKEKRHDVKKLKLIDKN